MLRQRLAEFVIDTRIDDIPSRRWTARDVIFQITADDIRRPFMFRPAHTDGFNLVCPDRSRAFNIGRPELIKQSRAKLD
jgi:hypothetical protein